VATLVTIPRIAIFVAHLHNLWISDQLTDRPQTGTPVCKDFNNSTCSRTPCRYKHLVVNAVAVTTPAVHAPTIGACTPLRPLILEWELSNHLDNTFVKQLINDLEHGCNIGYLGPQFACLATNLALAARSY